MEGPWLRQPADSARAHAAFGQYRDLGAKRSITNVARMCNAQRTQVARWSTQHAWVARARAWDEHQDRIAVALSTDTIQTMRLKQAEWGHTMQAAAIETLEARMRTWRARGTGAPPLTPTEAARLLQVGAALERAARGQEEAGTAATSREALNEWAATLETILTEPHADEPIP